MIKKIKVKNLNEKRAKFLKSLIQFSNEFTPVKEPALKK